MYNPNMPLITLDDIKKARKLIDESPLCWRTPTLHHVQERFDVKDVDLHLKLENMQTTGSFKIRGVLNQMNKLTGDLGSEEHPLLTISAGNYGKAFAFLASQRGLHGMVLMPKTAPMDREHIIKGYGVAVERCESVQLFSQVDKYVREKGMVFLHSYDDTALAAGYASAGLEIIEAVDNPDIVLVCCGGGGLVSGVAAAIKLSGSRYKDCRIYGVEPEGSRTMYESFKAGKPVSMAIKSVASGLSPPSAGANTYRHCREYVKDILLVSDSEIVRAMFHLYQCGLVVEPSGAAAFAALLTGKVPDCKGKRVVVMLTGGNVSPQELAELNSFHVNK